MWPSIQFKMFVSRRNAEWDSNLEEHLVER